LSRFSIRPYLYVLVLAGLALIAGCGGDGGSDEDPGTVLEETFGNETEVTSGVLGLSFEASAEGAQGGKLSATVEGPFQGDPDDSSAFPQLDLSAQVIGESEGEDVDFDGGLTVTEDQGFVEYQGDAYEVPPELLAAFRQAYQEQAQAADASQSDADAGAIFDQLGINPQDWIVDPTNEGTEDVEGTDSIHISGGVDVERLLSDLSDVAASTGAPSGELGTDELDLITGAVNEATVDVYSGEDDHILRRLDLSLAIQPPEDAGAGDVGRADVSFSLTLSDLNEDQEFTAPESARPLTELLDKLGVDLGPLAGLSAPPSADGTAGGTQTPDAEASAAYLECVNQAETPADFNACAAELR
jgi:hypothetical protein